MVNGIWLVASRLGRSIQPAVFNALLRLPYICRSWKWAAVFNYTFHFLIIKAMNMNISDPGSKGAPAETTQKPDQAPAGDTQSTGENAGEEKTEEKE